MKNITSGSATPIFIGQDKTYSVTEECTSIAFNELPSFKPFNKIQELFRNVIITEKIDGTNASITITDSGRIIAGKRSGYCTPINDNFGFAAWVEKNKDELLKLGVGNHYGEWFGKGINREYGLQDRRFALFETKADRNNLPQCVCSVPILYSGLFSFDVLQDCIRRLERYGSVLIPGFMDPEGIVIQYETTKQRFKVKIKSDTISNGGNNA